MQRCTMLKNSIGTMLVTSIFKNDIWILWNPTPFLFFYGPHPYGSTQTRGQMGAAAAGRCRSHSNGRPEPYLRPTPQLSSALAPLTHWARPGTEPASSWILVRIITTEPKQEFPNLFWKWFSQLLNVYAVHNINNSQSNFFKRRRMCK